jgi:small GTP-binding protein
MQTRVPSTGAAVVILTTILSFSKKRSRNQCQIFFKKEHVFSLQTLFKRDRMIERPPDQDLPQKVILLGNSGVGKTSLFNRWTNNFFGPSATPTIGATNAFKAVDLGKKVVKITLWATAGQEQCRSITPLYIRGSKCVIIVTEPSLESFGSIHGWIGMIRETLPGPIGTLLAINKCDLRDPWDAEELTAVIETHKETFSGIFAVSAKSGTNVDLLFQEAARIVDQASAPGSPDLFEIQKEETKCC